MWREISLAVPDSASVGERANTANPLINPVWWSQQGTYAQILFRICDTPPHYHHDIITSGDR